MSRTTLVLVILAAFGILPLVFAGDPKDAAVPSLVKICAVKSVFRDVDPRMIPALARYFQAVMESQTGLKGQLLTAETADELRRELAAGDVQLGVAFGIQFGWMRSKQPDLEPLMINIIDPAGLKALVVVAKDNLAKQFSDCRGQTLVLPKGNRADTGLFLSRLCKQCQSCVSDYFSDTRNCPSIEDALDEVVDHKAQVTITDGAALEAFQQRKPGRFARLRVLAESDPFPNAVVFCRRDQIDSATREKIITGLTTAHKSVSGSRLMFLMRLKRFEPVPGDYLGRVADKLKEYPPPQ